MTRNQFAKFLHVRPYAITLAVREIESENPHFFPERKGLIFNKNEMTEICRHLSGISELEAELLSEKFHDPEKRKYKPPRRVKRFVKLNKEFIKRQAEDESVKACCNCAFCIGKSLVGCSSKVHPYCRFYNKFVINMKVEKDGKLVRADLFEDCCETWTRGEPRLWDK